MSEIKKTDSEDTRKVKEESRAAREEKRAEERVAAAQRREEEKKAKLAAQEEKARIRAEKQAEEHERARLEAERREEERQRKIEERRNRKKYDGKGYGGWLAAVVSLSVAVLALGAIVTVGYFDLKDAKGDLVGGMHESVYELSEQVEQLDTDLAKVRVSQGNYETQKLLSDMLVRCRLAERAVEDFPVDGHGAQRLTAFFNEAGDCAQKMLLKLAAGGQLSEEDARQLEEYYRDMQTVREAMPALLECADTEKNLLGEGDFDKRFEDLTARLHSKGSSISKEKAEKSGEEIGEEAALERAKNFFSDYKVQDMRCTGKTEGAFSAYTIEFTDGAIPVESVVGKCVGSIGGLGDFAMFMQTPVGILVFVGVPVLLYIAYDVTRVVLYNRRAEKSKELQEKDDEIQRLRALVEKQSAEQQSQTPQPPLQEEDTDTHNKNA